MSETLNQLVGEVDRLKAAMDEYTAANQRRIDGLLAVIEDKDKTITRIRLESVASIEELERELEQAQAKLEKAA